ncbi:RagB/SusD family nutrient uptake outer membrane protein [Larkinella harenae]
MALVGAGLLTQSCSDYLKEEPYNKVTVGNLYTTREGIANGVNGLYARLRDVYISEYLIYLCEGPTDIWMDGAGTPVEFANWSLDASSGNVNSLWGNCYSLINQANSVIQVLSNSSIPQLTDDLKNRYLAEARFIRAHCYYHLVQQFGDVYLTTEPTTTVKTEAFRNPKDEVWKFIIDELTFCTENLPDSYPNADYGHVTKMAALHHLSRVYLTVKRDNTDLQKAKELAERVINSGRHSLVASHAALWDMSNQINSEVLFSIIYTRNAELNGNGNTAHLYFTSAYSEEHPGVLRVTEYGRPWSRLRPSWYYQNLFNEAVDQRWEDCFRTSWNITVNTLTEKSYDPNTGAAVDVSWKKGDRAMIIPKRPWTMAQVKAAWPAYVFLPDSLRATIDPNKDIQPNGPWPRNTKFQNSKMYATLIKHLDPTRPDANWTAGSRDVFVFRLADTYLLAAEASFLLGQTQQATDYLNVVRKRAAKTGMTADMTVKANDLTLDFVLDERARELGGEMHRWYDLQRTGKLLVRMSNPKINPTAAGRFKEHHVLRPIPREQLTRMTNPQDFTQNPGYGN